MLSALVQEKVVEVPGNQEQLHLPLARQHGAIAETFVLVTFGIAALGAIATFVTKEFRQKKAENNFRRRLSKIPCPNCQYFSKSSYLQCAVHPKMAMTEESEECSDFVPKT